MTIRYQHIFITLALAGASACDSQPVEPVSLPGWGHTDQCLSNGIRSRALQPDGAYCDAELIQWSYDADAEMLTFVHAGFEANCCTDHYAHAQLDGTEYQIVHTEQPLYPEAPTPCGCKCVFDLEIRVPVPSEPSIDLALLFHGRAPWNEKEETLWSGTIDLGAGAGEIVVSDGPISCQEGPPP